LLLLGEVQREVVSANTALIKETIKAIVTNKNNQPNQIIKELKQALNRAGQSDRENRLIIN